MRLSAPSTIHACFRGFLCLASVASLPSLSASQESKQHLHSDSIDIIPVAFSWPRERTAGYWNCSHFLKEADAARLLMLEARMRRDQPMLEASMRPLDAAAHGCAADGGMQQHSTLEVLTSLPAWVPRYQPSSSRHCQAAARWTGNLSSRAPLPALLLLLLAWLGLRGECCCRSGTPGDCAAGLMRLQHTDAAYSNHSRSSFWWSCGLCMQLAGALSHPAPTVDAHRRCCCARQLCCIKHMQPSHAAV